MRKRKGIKYPALLLAVSLAILAGFFGYAMHGKFSESDRADQATVQGQNQQAEAKALAAGIQQACARKVPEVAAYCVKARQVIAQQPIPGPPGRAGEPGAAGVPGRDGTPGRDGSPGIPGRNGAPGVPGRDGSPGQPGDDGTPGSDGGSGTDGADGTNGEPGKDGAPGQDGQPGKDGTDGTDGKGVVSVECTGVTPQTFRFTFTDGTSQTIECTPAPEPSPTVTPSPSE